jgi:hypothetical protein
MDSNIYTLESFIPYVEIFTNFSRDIHSYSYEYTFSKDSYEKKDLVEQ